MSSKTSIHYDWLQLIEVSGPFLSATVLNEAFPDGLDGFDKRTKRDLSHFYSEWVEAFETRHADFPALHDAWIRSVLRDGLQFRDGDLSPGAEWSVAGEGGLGRFAPDYALKDMDAKPALFVKILPADVKPDARDVVDDWKDSVIEKMTRLCRSYEVRIGLVTNGEKWVLVNAATGGTLSGTATWYARLWFQEDSTLRAFLALLGYRRFVGAPKKRLPYLLDESLKHLEEVTDTLGKQVMTAVEVLMEGFDRADLDSGRKLLAGVSPSALYEAALTVMMRLVFLLCAEERGLMLLGEKKYDDVYAVSTLRKKLEEESDKFGPQVLERRYDAWARLLSVFRLVYGGISHPDLLFPAMGGSLFNPEKFPFLEGRQLGLSMTDDNPPPLPIDNRTVLLILESLQVLKQKGGAIPLSFRSLDVEQIGYIYEGLLEFTGARADELLLGVKGDKTHQNPEIALAELESLALDSEEKLFARMKDLTGRTAIAREYAAEPDITLLPFLPKICRGDKKLEARILPYLNWLRTSEWGEPVVYHKDSFYVTEGRDRRSSGTHYTPKPLTEMIVKEALEPVVYEGPAKGTPRAEWKLKSPAELLSLKICDPAMGSGAFLVQACRYLGDRVVESWAAAEKAGKAIASNGTVTDFPPNDPMSEVLEDQLCEARRLVAERCLYGVDINPLAVELAKLSLWLVTISKGRPFGFLDHNLKSGDSLLGVSDIEQLAQFRMKPDPHGNLSLLSGTIRAKVAEALKEREEIREMRMRDITDVHLAETKNAKVETLLTDVRDYADYFIGEVFVAGKPTKKTAARLDAAAVEGEPLLGGDALKATILKKQTAANLAYDLPAGQTAPRRPFHWAIEFPEVFAQGGFNAIIGNPPFLGNSSWKSGLGTAYDGIVSDILCVDHFGKIDLSVVFHRRGFSLLRSNGTYGLIGATNISEGKAVACGLGFIVANGTIICGIKDYKWPGAASVRVAIVVAYKGDFRGRCKLSGRIVKGIDGKLLECNGEEETIRPICSSPFAFKGIDNSKGLSFVIDEASVEKMKYADHPLLKPYFTGEDINSSALLNVDRWAFDLQDKNITEIEKENPEIARFLWTTVRPTRTEAELASYRGLFERWWQFWNPRTSQYKHLRRNPTCIAISRITKYPFGLITSSDYLFLEGVILISFDRPDYYAIIISSFFREWCFKNQGAKFGVGGSLRLSVGDTLSTFPLPKILVGEDGVMIASRIDAEIKKYCYDEKCGVTEFLNRVHDKSYTDNVVKFVRSKLCEIDKAVATAYGWVDVDLNMAYREVPYLYSNDNIRYTISEPARIEILKRLSALNRQRWEEEEAKGLHKKWKK